MTILVFGQTGQVARALQRQAPDAIYLGRDQADLCAPETCVAAIVRYRPTAVINAAAYTAVDRAESEEALAHQINGVAPGEIAGACAKQNIPLVHISTDYVFNGLGDTAFAPTDPLAPLGAYGRSKRAGEVAVQAVGGPHAIVRTSWVFSADGSNFVKTMLRLSETRDRIKVVADQHGGPTPAAGIAHACLTIAKTLKADPAKSGTYHYSGAPDTSWADFARAVFRLSGRAVVVEDIATSAYPTPARRPANSRLDCTSLHRTFGLSRPDWQAALAEVLAQLEATP